MTKLVKTDREIAPATSLAGKVEEALGGGKLAEIGRSLLDRPRYVYDFSVSNRSEPYADCTIRRDDNSLLIVKLDAEGRCSWRTPSDTDMLYLPPGQRLVAEVEDRNSQGKPSMWTRFAYTMRVVGERQVYSVSVNDDGNDTYARIPDAPPVPSPYSREDWAAALGSAPVDAVGPGIPLTVEPLNPVLRVEGSRELVVDTETRLFDPGYPDEVERRILTRELNPGEDFKIVIPPFAKSVSVGPDDIVLYFQDAENTILYSIDAAQNGDAVQIASEAICITIRNYGSRKTAAKLTFRIVL